MSIIESFECCFFVYQTQTHTLTHNTTHRSSAARTQRSCGGRGSREPRATPQPGLGAQPAVVSFFLFVVVSRDAAAAQDVPSPSESSCVCGQHWPCCRRLRTGRSPRSLLRRASPLSRLGRTALCSPLCPSPWPFRLAQKQCRRHAHRRYRCRHARRRRRRLGPQRRTAAGVGGQRSRHHHYLPSNQPSAHRPSRWARSLRRLVRP